MGKATGIDWADSTWNPWRGCTKVSDGCAQCYMYREQLQYGHDPTQIVRASPRTFNSPLRWKDPRIIFVCSWSDFAHHEVPKDWRQEAWDIMREADHHIYLILTKRPMGLAQLCLPPDWDAGWPHVWLGITVENEKYYSRINDLAYTPAQHRWISAEPLLGPLSDLWYYAGDDKFEWIIVGGESAPKPRPMEEAWVLDIINQMHDTKVAVFVKQLGGKPRDKRNDPTDWPPTLRVREVPESFTLQLRPKGQ